MVMAAMHSGQNEGRHMILGLSGAKGSGKDTVAAYLVKTHGFERKAFADPLKKSIAALFDIPFSDIDRLKNHPRAKMQVVIESEYDESEVEILSDYTFRVGLQRYGTEAHRDVFGEDFWLDYTLPVGGYYPGRAIVVTDVRFENEANRVRQLDGYNVRIFRDSAPEDKDQHRSENFDFPYDLTILNHGDIDDLYVSVEEILTLAGHHIRVE